MSPADAPTSFFESAKRTLGSRFARDAAFLQIGAGVNLVSNLVTSVLLFRLFGAEGYGRYAEGLNLYALIYFVGNVGVAQLTVSRVSQGMGKLDGGEVARALGLFVKAYGLLSLILLGVGLLVGPWLGEVIQRDRTTGTWAAWLCFSGPLSLPFYFVQCALQGTRRMRILAEMENLKEIVRGFLVVAGALGAGSPVGAVFGELGGALLSVPLAILAYRKALAEPGAPLPRFREIVRMAREIRADEVREGIKIGVAVTFQKNLTAILPTIFPRILLAHFGTAKEVGYLNLAQNLMRLPIQALTGVSRTIMPVLGQLKGSGKEERLKSFLVKTMLYSGGAMVIVAGTLAVVLRFIVPALYGEPARPALELVPWLAVATALQGFAVGVEAFYLVVNRLAVANLINVVAMTIATGAGFLLISRWHAVGAAAYVALVSATAGAHALYVFSYFRALKQSPVVASP